LYIVKKILIKEFKKIISQKQTQRQKHSTKYEYLFCRKNVRKCYFSKNRNAIKVKGAFYYNWCPEYTSVDIKRPLKIRCAEIWSNTILKLQLNTHPNIYKEKKYLS
jgi:hypothetical protein